MNWVLQAMPWIMQVLKGLGVVKDPEQEREFKLRLMELAERKEIAQSEEFAAFMKATTPDAQYVWPWVNSVQALTRPALTWIVMGSVVASFFVPGLAARVTATLQAFSSAGTAGLLLLAIPAWWFFGRSIERIVPGLSMLRDSEAGWQDAGGRGGGVTAPRPSQVPQVPREMVSVGIARDRTDEPLLVSPRRVPVDSGEDDWPRSPEQILPEVER